MSISPTYCDRIEKIAPHLLMLSDEEIDGLIDSGNVLTDPRFFPKVQDEFGQFYAPFDWVNEDADIVLIGITPGRKQAKTALKSLKASLRQGLHVDHAARIAKQAASFEGDMRDIAARLMNRFRLQQLFGLDDSADLFGKASHRAHYTSLLRYPILHRRTKKKNGRKVTDWFDYGGGDKAFSVDLLTRSIREHFEPEIMGFKKAWLVPFGPTPARALEDMVARGLIDPDRVLPGINHPSATQWNRHHCQLNISDDHSTCGRNVGCETIRRRSANLEAIVSKLLSRYEVVPVSETGA